MTLVPIHPFPARMAPGLAHRALASATAGTRVLDPMCGSGTVLRTAVEAGLSCTGIDLDPLAVLMSRVWVTPLCTAALMAAAADLVQQAKALLPHHMATKPDTATEQFIAFWFAPAQRRALTRLAWVLRTYQGAAKDILSLALSRIIITKEMQAPLARDTSHSRPHRVALANDFDVYQGFIRAAGYLHKHLTPERLRGCAEVYRGDARTLHTLQDDAFDLAITSPPYLNAIDYLRGHKLALVWLGYDVSWIRQTRAMSIGAEKGLNSEPTLDLTPYVTRPVGCNYHGQASGLGEALCV